MKQERGDNEEEEEINRNSRRRGRERKLPFVAPAQHRGGDRDRDREERRGLVLSEAWVQPPASRTLREARPPPVCGLHGVPHGVTIAWLHPPTVTFCSIENILHGRVTRARVSGEAGCAYGRRALNPRGKPQSCPRRPQQAGDATVKAPGQWVPSGKCVPALTSSSPSSAEGHQHEVASGNAGHSVRESKQNQVTRNRNLQPGKHRESPRTLHGIHHDPRRRAYSFGHSAPWPYSRNSAELARGR